MSQNPKLVQHKRGPSSVLLKLLDHVSLVSINTPGTTTSFSFKCSNPEFAGFGLCQWFAFTSDPSSPTNSNQCDVPSSESSRKCWVFCTTCFCTSRRTRPKCNNTSKIHSPPAWKTVKISRMPSMWSMRSTMGSTMGSVRSTDWYKWGFQLLSQYSSTCTSSHFRRGFSTFKSFGLQVFHSFIFWVCYQIMQMIFLIFTFCRFLCNFWGRGRFGRRLKNFALHGEC